MPTLQNYENDILGKLFASEVKDATVAMDNNDALDPDTHNRTIIIGVGGTGVKTLDYIKGALKKRLKPSWSQYVAFLGVDASWTELENAHYLDGHGEGICITQTGVTTRMNQYSTYPRAVRRFMLDGSGPNAPIKLGNIDTDGAAMTRLVGKIKVHDQEPGNLGVDETIVNKLTSIISRMTLPPTLPGAAPSFYDVYVIGSGSGGTGSGSFLEMPALIREAMNGQPVHIHGILYMPDTLTGIIPESAGNLKANGYATLKELNYYQALKMRTDYKDVWTYSNSARPELEINSETGFFDIPYLIGSPGAAAADAQEMARETIAEFLISMLVKATPIPGAHPFLTSAFYSNAIAVGPMNDKDLDPGNPNREAEGCAHEFPKCFASIGFAEASAPEKVIRAYAVKETCKNAGLKPVSDEEMAVKKSEIASGKPVLLPFRGIDQRDNATVGTATAQEILKPLADIQQMIHSGKFNFITDLKLPADTVTWDAIKANNFENPGIKAKINAVIEGRTTIASMDQLRQSITKRYNDYRKNVQDYVQKEGPFAFINLYRGNFLPVSGNYGMGIATMLQNLVEGKLMNGNPYKRPTVEAASKGQTQAKQTIDKTTFPFGFIDLHNKKGTQLNEWLNATNALHKARIDEKRREVALGRTGALMSLFVEPAALLADQLESFGYALSALTDVYVRHGNDMEDFNKFADATDNKTEVNVASVNTSSYGWLKQQSDAAVAVVNARNFRNGLVEAFFADPIAWLDVPQHLVMTTPAGEVKLVTPDKPVPARELFDRYATDAINVKEAVDVSILALFEELQKKGTPYQQTAQILLEKLHTKSQIRFNGKTHSTYVHKYVKYPNSLNTVGGNGPAVVNAIKAAAANFGVSASSVYPSEDTNTIMFYQQATNLEVYRVNGLENWEEEYEARTTGKNLLHGKSPDVVRVVNPDGSISYQEGQSWVDYPSIVCKKNPERPDPITGRVCREGLMRQKLHEEVEEAKRLGVLYSQQDASGKWVIMRVNCDKSTNWVFDPSMCTPDPVTELLPQGKTLVAEVANQNGKQVWQMTRVVRLENAKLFSDPAATEPYAWEYAERVLRAHHPMMVEVRNTVRDYFRAWDAKVDAYNKIILEKKRPAMMVYLLKASIVDRRADGAWVWKKADGTTAMIANYAANMMAFLPGKEKNQIAGGLLSYNLYKRVDRAMPGDVLKSEYLRAKSLIEQWINMGDMIPLQAGQALADITEQEIAALKAKGAGDGIMPTTMAFITAMSSLEPDQKTIREIEEFYHRASQWGTI